MNVKKTQTHMSPATTVLQIRMFCILFMFTFSLPAAALESDIKDTFTITFPSVDDDVGVADLSSIEKYSDIGCTDNAPTEPLELLAIVEMALCRNPQLRASWAAVKGQAAAVGEARASAMPSVSATTTRLRTRTDYPDTNSTTVITGQAAYLTLNWRIFDFGGQRANQAMANSLLIAAMASRDESIQRVMGSTIDAYFEMQSALAGVAAMVKSEMIARDLLDSAKRRSKNGVIGRSDILQAQTAHAKVALEKNRMEGALDRAKALLVYSTGMRAGSDLRIASASYDSEGERQASTKLKEAVGELTQLLHDAERYNPQIQAAGAQWQAARYREVATRAEGLPTVDVSANYNRNGYPGQGLSHSRSNVGSVGFSITFPLFDGFAHRYKLRRVEAESMQRQYEFDDTKHNVLTDVIKAHADAVSALRNLDASRELLDSAEQSLQSSRKRYEFGATDIVEILNAQRALVDAELERIRCLGDWGVTRLRLMATTGTLALSMVRPNQ